MNICEYNEMPFKGCVESVTKPLAELLRSLVLAGLALACYETFDKDIAAIRIDYSAGISGMPFEEVKKKMNAACILIDAGIGELPEDFPGLEFIARPDEENRK